MRWKWEEDNTRYFAHSKIWKKEKKKLRWGRKRERERRGRNRIETILDGNQKENCQLNETKGIQYLYKKIIKNEVEKEDIEDIKRDGVGRGRDREGEREKEYQEVVGGKDGKKNICTGN